MSKLGFVVHLVIVVSPPSSSSSLSVSSSSSSSDLHYQPRLQPGRVRPDGVPGGVLRLVWPRRVHVRAGDDEGVLVHGRTEAIRTVQPHTVRYGLSARIGARRRSTSLRTSGPSHSSTTPPTLPMSSPTTLNDNIGSVGYETDSTTRQATTMRLTGVRYERGTHMHFLYSSTKRY